MRWKLAALAATTAAILPVLALHAQEQVQQPVCGLHETMVERLEAAYKEKRVGAGLAHDGMLVEVFASSQGNTWSMIVTLPTGKACLIGAGEAWQTPTGKAGPHAWLMPED